MTSRRAAPFGPALVGPALVGVGLFVSLCSLVVHRHAWWVGGLPVPWGLALSLAAGYAAGRASGLLGGMLGVAAFGAGWVAVLLAALAGRPEGDYLVAADVRGYTYLIGGIALVGLAVWQSVRTPAPGSSGATS